MNVLIILYFFTKYISRILHASPTMVDCVTEYPLEVLPHNNLVPRRDRKAWKYGFGRLRNGSSMSRIHCVANRHVMKDESGTMKNVGRVVHVLEKLVEIIKEITGKEKIR